MKRILLTALAATLLVACATDDPDRELMRPDGGDDAGMTGGDASSNNNGDDVGGDGNNDNNQNNVNNGDDMGGGDDPDMVGGSDDMGGGDDDAGNNGVCRPNRDGTIERDEVPFIVGASAKFMVAEEVTFDTAGTMEMGTRTWDLSVDLPGEYLDVLQLRDPTGEWFETSFPNATYFTPLSATSDLLGVFQATDDQLLLLGVVSPDDGFYRTELEYDPAIPILDFPLTQGKTWSVESAVSGQFDGVVSFYDEVYDFEVDAEGALLTDFGNFQVLRVRTTLDRQVGFVNTIIRSFAFVTECFGTVATVSSQEDEQEVEFMDVAELKRIAP